LLLFSLSTVNCSLGWCMSHCTSTSAFSQICFSNKRSFSLADGETWEIASTPSVLASQILCLLQPLTCGDFAGTPHALVQCCHQTRGGPKLLPLHKHPVSTNCLYHLVTLLCGVSFLNRTRNSRCTVITYLDASKRRTHKAFSCCDAILKTGPAAPQ
jgi:hypothetical protein